MTVHQPVSVRRRAFAPLGLRPVTSPLWHDRRGYRPRVPPAAGSLRTTMTDDIYFHVYVRCRPRAFRERDLHALIERMHECARDTRSELLDACQCRGLPAADAEAEAAACLAACIPVWRAQLRRACWMLRLPVPEVWVEGHRI